MNSKKEAFDFYSHGKFTISDAKNLITICEKWDSLLYDLVLCIMLRREDIDKTVDANLVAVIRHFNGKARAIAKTLNWWRDRFSYDVGGYVRCIRCGNSIPIDCIEGTSPSLYKSFPHDKKCRP